jgi:hypothetical protein
MTHITVEHHDGGRVKSIDKVIRSIREADETGDHELAHSLQDALYITVLTAIAHGAPRPVELAKAVLQAEETDAPRWAA